MGICLSTVPTLLSHRPEILFFLTWVITTVCISLIEGHFCLSLRREGSTMSLITPIDYDLKLNSFLSKFLTATEFYLQILSISHGFKPTNQPILTRNFKITTRYFRVFLLDLSFRKYFIVERKESVAVAGRV